MEKQVDFKSLRYVMAVVEKRNISLAAKELGISQPSLSKYLSNLAGMLGVHLFERENGLLVPTYAGRQYFDASRRILEIAAELDTLRSGDALRNGAVRRNSALDFRELRYFVTVAHEMNLSRSAEKLYISQPALSEAITNLEQKTGIMLFNRLRHGLALTEKGTAFFNIAVKILQVRDELYQKMEIISKGLSGRIRLGISYFFSGFLLPRSLSEFKRRYPDIEIDINTQTSSVLEQMLQERTIDVAIVVESIFSKDIMSQVLFYEPILLAVSPENPLVNQGQIGQEEDYPFLPPESLRGQSFILSAETMRLRQSAEEFFHLENIPHKIAIVTASVETANRLAALNSGIAFIPETYAESVMKTPASLQPDRMPRYFRTSKNLADWKVSIAWKKQQEENSLVWRFAKVFKEFI